MLDQTSRYSDLTLKEEDLIANGKHVLAAYKMKPAAGFFDYIGTAAHFAAESSTGTNVQTSTTDDFAMGLDALCYEIDEEKELMKLAFPIDLFDRNITDGRAMVVSLMTCMIGNNQAMGDIEYAKLLDFYVPPNFMRLFDGPAKGIKDMWRILGRPLENGGMVVGTIIKPKLGLRPKPFADACYQFWLGGDFIKNDEPQGNQVYAPMKESIPLIVDAMKRAQDETGQAKLFSANITADDPAEMIARGEYILEQFGYMAENVAFLVDGFVGGCGMITNARRNFPNQFIHYHRAGHGMVTGEESNRGYTALVHMKWARMSGASGIHTGTMGFGKMEGYKSDTVLADALMDDVSKGTHFTQPWGGMAPTAAIVSGGMNAVRLPGFFENLGHCNVIQTSGGGALGHKDGIVDGAKSLRQAYEAWQEGADIIEYAKEHKEFRGAFESFPGDADKVYPGWREKLGVHK